MLSGMCTIEHVSPLDVFLNCCCGDEPPFNHSWSNDISFGYVNMGVIEAYKAVLYLFTLLRGLASCG